VVQKYWLLVKMLDFNKSDIEKTKGFDMVSLKEGILFFFVKVAFYVL
jgi:hypothetical protein